MNPGLGHIVARKAITRGIAHSGPAILSYGFRPFFLLAGCFAFLAMAGWIGALSFGWELGGSYGALNWHAHEMLFGYASAALAGFLLTAIPNWTGRLPVSGLPLLGIVTLWMAGRVAMAFPDIVGLPLSLVLDACFLPTMAFIAGTEIVAGKNWKNLKILVALLALSAVNVAFHLSATFAGSPMEAARAAIAIYVVLIALVGGRIIPSFTRNFLVKAGSAKVPKPFGRFDIAAILVLLLALVAWVALPDGLPTALLAATAAILHAVRLFRWRGWQTIDEPLLVAMHVAYGFVVLGMGALALSAMDWIAAASALHVLTVGVIGGMTLAVMTRASLGHTGRALTASGRTSLAYLALALSAVVRPFAELVPDAYHLLLVLSAAGWLLAFGLFVAEYGPILTSRRPESRRTD
jgi:uncharacterized protein involved in response to NO